MAEEVRKMRKLCALFAALLLLHGCAAAVEEPLSLDINAPRFEGTAKGLDWEFIEPPEGEFYYEVCASAGKLYYICNDMLWGTSGGIYVSDMDGGGMRQLLGPEDIVYTDIFDTCSDGEGGLWLLLMGGRTGEFDEGLLFDSFVTRIMDAGPEHGLCIELGSYVLDIDPETGEQRQVLCSEEFEGVFGLRNYESIGGGRYLADGKISTPNGERNICVLITARS